MIKKQKYIQQQLDIYFGYYYFMNHATDEVKNDYYNYKKRIFDCKTDNELVNLCNEVDEHYDFSIGVKFCRKFKLPYTGKLTTNIEIIYNSGFASDKKNVKQVEYIEDDDDYGIVIDQNSTLWNPKIVRFDDKEFHISSKNDIKTIIQYFKELREKIKLQTMANDFK